ncbi:MAG TPA: 2-dehydropantoate 2-reductase [Acidobacteriota bacterium]|nr:2-dehydropantoate 2-reductase [Acidobacteriota bacterium]
MKILIIGPGAVGCILGASLIRSGHDVTFVARGSSLNALQQKGIKVEWPSETWQIDRVHAIDSGSQTHSYDHTFFCVKGYDWADASKLLKFFQSRFILTFQNGVIVHKELQKDFGDSVRAAVIYVSADRVEPGVIRSKSNARVVLDGSPMVRDEMQALQEALMNSWLAVQISENIEVDLWRKYLFLCSFSALNTLTEKPIGNLLGDLLTKQLWISFMNEIVAIGRSSGIELSENDVQNTISNAEQFPHNTTSSLFSDTQRKQKTEVELLQGHLARLAEQYNLPATISKTIYTLLRQKTAF